MSDFVKLALNGAVATVTIDRPEALNALDPDFLEALVRTFVTLNSDFSI